jgi:DoxX
MGPFVGTVETVCGALIILGLFTRLAAIPLIIIMVVAIVSTKMILMVTDSLTVLNRKRVFEYAAAHRLPAIYEFDFLVRDGGLMSYGPDFDENFARVAALIHGIFSRRAP